jgi:hypothetical protein
VIGTGGYVRVLLRGHPRADRRGYVAEHLLKAEQALGHLLPSEAEVHHVNETRSDNENKNLVICENHAYHLLLHQRKRAVIAGYPAHWLSCRFCKVYDTPENLHSSSTMKAPYHLDCDALRQKLKRALRHN